MFPNTEQLSKETKVTPELIEACKRVVQEALRLLENGKELDEVVSFVTVRCNDFLYLINTIDRPDSSAIFINGIMLDEKDMPISKLGEV